MRRLERDMAEAVAAELDARRRALFADLTDDNAEREIMARLASADYWQPLTDVMTAWLQKIAGAGTEQAADDIDRHVLGTVKAAAGAIGFDWTLANNEAAAWALRHGRTLAGQLAKTTTERIQQEVANWILNKESIRQLALRIQDGYLYSYKRAETIAITEVTRAYAAGNREAWRSSGVVTEIRWRTANDERVCPICAPMEDVITEVQRGEFEHPGGDGDRGRWRGSRWQQPPAHNRCRCWLVPVVRRLDADLSGVGL